MKTHRPITTGIALLSFLALIAGSSGGRAAAATATTFSGQASVISGQVAGIPVSLVDTGPVDAGGGHLHARLLEYPGDLPDATGGALKAEVLHATVVAHGNKSSADAVVADFSLTAAGQTISAEFLAAHASASCNSGTATITGSSEVVGLTINGQTVTVGTEPQTITLPLGVGSIRINEQPVASASGDSGAITVNALHIMLTDPVLGTRTDLIVASAHADIVCATQAGNCANKDFVTGGGWIMTKSGSRATFAVAGGPGGWGHFQYIDHGSGLRIKGTGVTFYGPGTTGATSRQIDGTGQWTGGSGTYSVEVADNGEPGHYTDLFWMKAPTVENEKLGGGNIQLHCK